MKFTLLLISLLAVGMKAPVVKTKLFSLPLHSWIAYDGFHALHQWNGTTKDVTCVITYNTEKQTVEAIAASAKLLLFDSGNGNRDSHALEMLDALVFPKVNFTSAAVIPTGEGLQIHGKLNLHGVTKAITVNARSSLSNNKMRVEGTFPVQLKDYNIEIPALLGIKIKDEIKVRFMFVFDVDQ
jgi:polyisoprenoid-binding protein YceI